MALRFWKTPGFWVVVAKSIVTVAAFMIIARYVDPVALFRRFREISPVFVLATLLLALGQYPLVSARWRLIAQKVHSGTALLPPKGKFCQIIFVSTFFNQFMPFIAGDALRVFYLRDAGSPLRVAFKSTVLDRGVALIALFALAPLSVVLLPRLFGEIPGAAWVIGAAVGSLVVLGVMLAAADRIAGLTARWRITALLGETLKDMHGLLIDPRTCVLIIILSIGVQAISCAIFGLLAQGEGSGLDPVGVMAVAPVIILASFLPIAIAGWGVREGITVVLLSRLGAPPEAALVLSVSFGIVALLSALPGSVLLLFAMWDRRAAPSELPL